MQIQIIVFTTLIVLKNNHVLVRNVLHGNAEIITIVTRGFVYVTEPVIRVENAQLIGLWQWAVLLEWTM